MHPRAFVRVLSLGVLFLFVACCGPRVVVLRGGPTPAWVDKLPQRRGELCAVGYSGPTFYQQDCVKNASENARGHLAESISVTIRTITIDISDGTRGMFAKDVFVQGSESASEAVLQGSEVQAQWVDLQGQRGANNGCYAMVCIDPNKPIEKLVEKLEEEKIPPKTIKRVRENAEAAFEELEKAEQKAMEKKAPPPPPPPEEEKTEGTPETPPEGEESPDDATPAVRKIELPTE
ncbi:hypothetical protein ACFL2F_04720 [Myxococcota bacterium]